VFSGQPNAHPTEEYHAITGKSEREVNLINKREYYWGLFDELLPRSRHIADAEEKKDEKEEEEKKDETEEEKKKVLLRYVLTNFAKRLAAKADAIQAAKKLKKEDTKPRSSPVPLPRMYSFSIP
jgi:hypothetical protein